MCISGNDNNARHSSKLRDNYDVCKIILNIHDLYFVYKYIRGHINLTFFFRFIQDRAYYNFNYYAMKKNVTEKRIVK